MEEKTSPPSSSGTISRLVPLLLLWRGRDSDRMILSCSCARGTPFGVAEVLDVGTVPLLGLHLLVDEVETMQMSGNVT